MKKTILLCACLLTACKTEKPTRVQELLRSQRATGTNEFHHGWNAALDNLQHHLKHEG